MKNNKLFLTGIGVVSGIVNATLANFVMLLLVGIPFGIVTGVYFISTSSFTRKYFRLFSWVLASGVSYPAGFITTMMVAYQDFFPKPGAIDFAFGGFIGALVLSIAFHFIFHKLSVVRHIVTVVLGAGVAFLVAALFLNLRGSSSEALFYMVLFIVWQTAITVALGSSLLVAQNVAGITKDNTVRRNVI